MIRWFLRLIGKGIRYSARKWRQTSSGKWHIELRSYNDDYFVPVCWRKSSWMIVDSANRMPPKGSILCKTCDVLRKNLY